MTTDADGLELFDDLIRTTCELVQLAEKEVWVKTETPDCRVACFGIADVECIVSHRIEAPARVFVHCKFGPLPDTASSEAMLSLLTANLLMYSEQAPSFGLDLERNVVLCMSVTLTEVAGPNLVQLLEKLTEQALAWRDSHVDKVEC